MGRVAILDWINTGALFHGKIGRRRHIVAIRFGER
jgi:hypothetical protein